MNNYRRPHLFLLLLVIISNFQTYAQKEPINDYLSKAGEYITLYNGQIEPPYKQKEYETLPYFPSANFMEGEIVYNKNYYPQQQVRLDLYKELLIVLTPKKKLKVIVPSSQVESVKLHGHIFVWLTPPLKNGLKPGYYDQLFNGKHLKLLCKEKFEQIEKEKNNQRVYYFKLKTRYFIIINNQYYQVKNAGSFSKLYPELKKQIDQFSKEKKLNFQDDTVQSMNDLASYCEELLTRNDSP